MSLKATVDTLDSVPENVREYYAEKDGKYHLAVEGVVPKGKLDEFRTRNTDLLRERDDLLARFDGIDPEQARKYADQARKQHDGQLLAAGKVDELVTERTTAMKADYERRLKAITDENTRSKTQLEELVIGNGLRDAAAKAGVRAAAIDDVLLRGRSVFKVVDGKAVPYSGDQPLYGRAGEPVSLSEWMSGLVDAAPHLFEQSSGGGARHAQPGSAGGYNRIARDDTRAFLANVEAIAKGTVKVG